MYGCLYQNPLGSRSEQGRPGGPILRVYQRPIKIGGFSSYHIRKKWTWVFFQNFFLKSKHFLTKKKVLFTQTLFKWKPCNPSSHPCKKNWEFKKFQPIRWPILIWCVQGYTKGKSALWISSRSVEKQKSFFLCFIFTVKMSLVKWGLKNEPFWSLKM